jgi:poly(A) polymerase
MDTTAEKIRVILADDHPAVRAGIRQFIERDPAIEVLAEAEELASIRPDLDGNEIMGILGIGPGRDVGEAYRWLMERRLDEGPLGRERAEQELRQWWAARTPA